MIKNKQKGDKKENNPTHDWWGRGFVLVGILLAAATLYFQFLNNKHSFSANIRNTYVMPDTTFFEVIFINDGDYKEIIKRGGFVFTPIKSNIRHNEYAYLIENTEIEKGDRKMVKLKYQTYTKRNLWELGLAETDTSGINIYFYLITLDDKGREYKCETKIGYIDRNLNYIDSTPVLIDLINPDKTRKIND